MYFVNAKHSVRFLLFALSFIVVTPIGSLAASRDGLGIRKLLQELGSDQPAEAKKRFIQSSDADSDSVEPVGEYANTVEWLTVLSEDQALFHEADLEGLRSAVLQMTPDDLTAWLTSTGPLRERLQGEDWALVQEWLRNYLRVQSHYDDADIANFKTTMAELSPKQLMKVVDHFEDIFVRRMQRRTAYENTRSQRVRAYQSIPVQGQPTARAIYGSGNRTASVQPNRTRRRIRREGLSMRFARFYLNRGIYGRFFLAPY